MRKSLIFKKTAVITCLLLWSIVSVNVFAAGKGGKTKMKLTVGNTTLTATLENNSSAEALKDLLSKGPVTIDMRDYASMEKVGTLPKSLPRNDRQITTKAGDLILYQGNAFVIYYARNDWNFTKLGSIDNTSAEELKRILGRGDVSVTLSLE